MLYSRFLEFIQRAQRKLYSLSTAGPISSFPQSVIFINAPASGKWLYYTRISILFIVFFYSFRKSYVAKLFTGLTFH